MFERAKIITALLLALASATSALADGEILVKVSQQASVRSPAFTLGEISVIEAADESMAAQLGNMRLAVSPMPGSWRELEREVILSQLQMHGFGTSRLNLECPDVIRIYRESQTIEQSLLERRLRDFIVGNAPWDPRDMEITSVTRTGDIVLPAGELTVNIQHRGSANYLGPTPFTVELVVDGQSAQQIMMQAQISVYREAVVAVNPVPARSIIDLSDIELRKIDISTVRGKTLDSVDDVAGMCSTVFVQPGQVIIARNLTKPILVRRNETISLIASKPGFVIRTTGIAQSDGRRGEVIRVLNPSSRKILEAEVTGPQRARVIF